MQQAGGPPRGQCVWWSWASSTCYLLGLRAGIEFLVEYSQQRRVQGVVRGQVHLGEGSRCLGERRLLCDGGYDGV